MEESHEYIVSECMNKLMDNLSELVLMSADNIPQATAIADAAFVLIDYAMDQALALDHKPHQNYVGVVDEGL